jgi:hypothetical protein
MFSRFLQSSCVRAAFTANSSGMVLAAIALAAVTATSPASAQTTTNKLRSGQQYASQQIQVAEARPAGAKSSKPVAQKQAAVRQSTRRDQATAPKPRTTQSQPEARPASLVRRAAHGEVMEEMPPSRIVSSEVAQASHVCGCDQCSTAFHAGHIGHGEVVCGAEPVCGIEGNFDPAFPFEPSCGFESGCGGVGCDAGACNDCVAIRLPILRIDWRRFDFFAGVNSFTGPANHANDGLPLRGGSGSFGFYEGFNEGRSLNRLFGLDLSSQFGVRATQSSLSGAEFTEDSRNQVFVTGGLFRRVDFGLQYGVVVDYLYDDWWYRNNLTQLRGEISWNDNCGREFGYQFMASSDSSTSTTNLIGAGAGTATFEPTNQHRLFLRGNTTGGATYMAFAGGTDQGDGLLGGLLTSNFRNRFAVQGGVTYLIPNESNRAGGFANESWNLSMGIVFRPGGRNGAGRYCRPMFDVADNGTFLVDRVD